MVSSFQFHTTVYFTAYYTLHLFSSYPTQLLHHHVFQQRRAQVSTVFTIPPTPRSSTRSSASRPVADVPCASSKATGQVHSLKGTAVEAIGNLTGSDSWTQSGKEEHTQGEAEYKAAQAKGYAEGTTDRLGGKKDAIVGAVTGDREQEVSGKSASTIPRLPAGCSYMASTADMRMQATSATTRARPSRTSTRAPELVVRAA